jgi:precorrin-2 dehydrogenase / sirohydrochlorin ferrochelatase
MLPISLRLTNQPILVVGGGAVGLRKARAILEAGGFVRIIDPRPSQTQEPVEWVETAYDARFLEGVRLVFATATPEVNRRVVADARERNIWVNSATEPDEADFDLPAVLRRGSLTIATSTGGVAPSLARRIREKLDREFPDDYSTWLELLGEIRGEILAQVDDAQRRRKLLDEFADWPWLQALQRDGADAVRQLMRKKLEG